LSSLLLLCLGLLRLLCCPGLLFRAFQCLLQCLVSVWVLRIFFKLCCCLVYWMIWFLLCNCIVFLCYFSFACVGFFIYVCSFLRIARVAIWGFTVCSIYFSCICSNFNSSTHFGVVIHLYALWRYKHFSFIILIFGSLDLWVF
jgi:hypothetical protein